MAWNALLLAVGMAVGGNAERLKDLFSRYQLVAWALLAVIVCGLMIRWWVRRPAGARP